MTTTRRVIDLLDGDLYAEGPYETYAWLREHAPLYWDPINELWAVSRYDDIVDIEKHKDVFISSDQVKGGYRPNMPADPGLIGTDDPLHHGLSPFGKAVRHSRKICAGHVRQISTSIFG